MKENWERVKPVKLLSDHEIEEMLQSFLPGKKLKSAQLLGGGYSNSNYKLHIESLDRPIVLRVSNQNVCQVEAALHEKLHKQLPVPEIYYSKCNMNISFSLMEWIDGVQLKEIIYSNQLEPIKQAAYTAGYWLAEIRKNTFTESGMFNEKLEVTIPLKITPDTFLSFMEEFLVEGQTGNWLGKEFTRRLWDFSRQNSPFLKDIDQTPGLVHSDYNGLNILVSAGQAPNVTGIIDWEFAFAGPVYVDIGNMLRYENCRYFAEFEQAFLEGIKFGGIRLNQSWKRIAKLNDLIALCDLLNNTHAGKNKVKDIKRVILQTMENWDEY